MKKIKEPKKKPPYSILSNLRFTFSNLWKWDKSAIIVSFLRIPSNVFLPLLGTFMAKYVVDVITNNGSMTRLLLYILIFSLAMIALQIINNVISSKLEWKSYFNRIRYMTLINEKFTDADYEVIEDPNNNNKYSKAFSALDGGTEEVIETFVRTLTNFFGIISYGIIIFNLNPLLIVLLMLLTFGNFLTYTPMDKWHYNNREKWVKTNRKLYYLQSSACDFSSAKDIKLYNLSAWFKTLLNSLLAERMKWEKKWNLINFSADSIWVALTFVRDVVSYGYLIYRMLATGMPVSDFILYFAAIGAFSGYWLDFMWNFIVVNRVSLSICDIREFLNLPDKSNRGKGIDLPTETSEIEFRNVSFKYPKADDYTIKNQSFKIAKGEKIAIVGLNGAGKTTLIKLMCGLYQPTEGEILVNGKNIQEYNRDEYLSMFSAVFQDIHEMPVPISQNITSQELDEIDYDKLEKVIKQSGFEDKINSLPKGVNTYLFKSYHDEAIDLSGGEMQKLALARALYKDGKIIILDEPTAALDPIAESKMYMQYNDFTAGRTSVYISHRLSSTRFCDRILFLEDGKVIETGSHDELMVKGGKYAEMFDIQSHYYKENLDIEGDAENVIVE